MSDDVFMPQLPEDYQLEECLEEAELRARRFEQIATDLQLRSGRDYRATIPASKVFAVCRSAEKFAKLPRWAQIAAETADFLFGVLA